MGLLIKPRSGHRERGEAISMFLRKLLASRFAFDEIQMWGINVIRPPMRNPSLKRWATG
jgi:hypothetical protein